MLHAFADDAVGLLAWGIEDVAVYVHLPAVVEAAKAPFLVPTEAQRRSAMGAVLTHEANTAAAVAKRD